MDYNFEDYWTAMQPAPQYQDRKTAAELQWNNHPEKQASIMAWLKKHGSYSERNPYFFIQDFTPSQKLREPTFLRGDEKGDIVQVKYHGKYLLCYRDTANQFNLEITKDPW